MRMILRFFFLLFLLPGSSFAQELGPEELVKKITEDVLAAIKSDKQLAAGDRQKAIKLAEEKILPHVDFEEATRLAVGRGWAKASPEQKKQIVTEFRNMLVRTYSNAIGGYEGQTMKVMPVRMKPGDTTLTPLDEARRAFERDYLVRILKITGGNVTKAARLAGRNRTEFYRLLERHSLEPGMFNSNIKGDKHDKERAAA